MNAVYLAGSVAVMVKLYARRVEWPRVSWPVPGRTQVTVAVSGEAAASAREVTGPGAVSTCTVYSVYRGGECVHSAQDHLLLQGAAGQAGASLGQQRHPVHL